MVTGVFFPLVLCNLNTIQLKRDESIRIRKEAEEAELQRMKAIQREKVSGWPGGWLILRASPQVLQTQAEHYSFNPLCNLRR